MTRDATPEPTTRHTPGPWRVDWCSVDEHYFVDSGERPDGAIILLAEGIQREADARLIAASPDLLSACEAFLRWVGGEPEPDLVRLAAQVKGAVKAAKGGE